LGFGFGPWVKETWGYLKVSPLLRGETFKYHHVSTPMANEPIYTVEVTGEWRMDVFESYVLTIDYYEEFAEIVFT
jgi:hypothetical protein